MRCVTGCRQSLMCWSRCRQVAAVMTVKGTHRCCHTHTHPFNGPFSGTTQVSRYQKGKTDLDFIEARDSEWQWHQLPYASCGDAFPIEQVLVATYLLSVEALPHCRCGVANKSCMVWRWLVLIGRATVWHHQQGSDQASSSESASLGDEMVVKAEAGIWTRYCSGPWVNSSLQHCMVWCVRLYCSCVRPVWSVDMYDLCGQYDLVHVLDIQHRFEQL